MGSDNGLLRAAMPWAAEASPARPVFLAAAAAGLLIVILGTVLMVVTVRRSGRIGPTRSRRQAKIQREAAADVAAMREDDDRFFRPDGPGQHEDDL